VDVSHTSGPIQAWLAEHPRVHLAPLPAMALIGDQVIVTDDQHAPESAKISDTSAFRLALLRRSSSTQE
jgi:hypothetical protein